MLVRIAVLAVLTVSVHAQGLKFSPWYGEALAGNGILDMDDADVARFERTLAANPDDFPTRLKLMAFHRRRDRSELQADLAKLKGHALWLIEHHPESELLHSFVSQFSQGQLSPAELQRSRQLWETAIKARPRDITVLWNAASFFAGLDQGLRWTYLEASALADPEQSPALGALASLYSTAILEQGPLAARAQAALDASKNRWVLGNAANMLHSHFNAKEQFGVGEKRLSELAERYFLRAKALDPSMDRNKILPPLDMPAIARERAAMDQKVREAEARRKEGFLKIRRLTADAFPQLPAPIAGVMRARGCTVPQPFPDGAPLNVIRGQFFQNGESGWALFCTVGNSTSLLAFRNDHDTNPDTISTSASSEDDAQARGDGRFGYSNELFVVEHETSMRNYRANGGPKPPPLDHQAIDDGFLEKGSARWYFYQGKWLQFPGWD